MPAPSGGSAPAILVVGGGIVGLATAWKLLLANPRARVTVLEKEDTLGRHQSGHNSGVLHAGLYYKPGSHRARLAVAGIREMSAFCATHDIPHEICGKLVVAVDEEERTRLAGLHERGVANGLRGLEMLDPARMREIEPHVGGVAALRVPEEGIADYPRVCETLGRLIREAGSRVVTRARVDALRSERGRWIAETTAGDFHGDFVVTCAGLHADRVARMAGATPAVRIVPFRGEYFQLRAEREHLVRHLIYPVPDPRFPFLGVHFTRMIGGGVEAGPNAVLAFAREGYTKRAINLYDVVDAVTYPGLWRFIKAYPAPTWMELQRSFSRRRFAMSLQRLVPEVQESDLQPGGAGVRAQAMRPDGRLEDDFLFVEGPGALYILNAPSPAATASLAIGGEIAARVLSRLGAA
jgi:L-2-hydroxyglutarate oxidase